MNKISLTGKKCVIAHLLDEGQVKRFLEYCCVQSGLEAKGSPKVKLHQKRMVPEASGLGGYQKLQENGSIGVSTFPYLDRNGGFVEISAEFPEEVEGFREIAEAGIQQFFGALTVIEN